MRTLRESIFDANEDSVSKAVDKYKDAIDFIKNMREPIHPNTLSSYMMEIDYKWSDDRISQVLLNYDDYSEEMFNLMKVLCEISANEEWYRTFIPDSWQCDDDIEIDLSICEPKKIYKEMTGPQYVALVDLGMWRMDKVSDIEEWILIRDKHFDNQSWIFFIKKGLRPIHKRVLRELIKRYIKLKVK